MAAIAQANTDLAHASVAELGESAARVWERVRDAEAVAGMSLASLLDVTATAHRMADNHERASEVWGLAAAACGLEASLDRAHFLHEKAMSEMLLDHVVGEEGLWEVIQTVAGLTADPKARELGARAAATLALLNIDSQRHEEGLRVAAEAVRLAEGDPELSARAITYLGHAQACCGKFDAALATFDKAAQVLPDDVLARWRVAYFRGTVEAWGGLYDAAADRLEIARAETAAAGLGSCCTSAMERLVMAEWERGRWDQAVLVSRDILRRPPADTAPVTAMITILRTHLWRGDLGEASAMAARLRATLVTRWTDLTSCDAAIALAEVELAFGRLSAAWDELLQPWRNFDPLPYAGAREFIWTTARVMRILHQHGLAAPGLPIGDGGHGRWLHDQLGRVRWTPSTPAWLALIDAEVAVDDANRWGAAVEALSPGTTPAHLLPYARMRWAETLADADAQAADRQRQLASLEAKALGVDELLPSPQTQLPDRTLSQLIPALLASLTAREQEVLLLVIEGLTNGEIGKRLFISTQTASVHVSAIPRKMGVATRTEAAVVASRPADFDRRVGRA